MNDRPPPNPYRPDRPIFEDDDERAMRTRARSDIERPPREALVFDSDEGDPPRGDDGGEGGAGWDGDDFGDYGRGSRRGGGGSWGFGNYISDRGLFRVLGLLALLAVVIVALVLPYSPIRIIGRGTSAGTGTEGITASARDSMPALPNGFVALSKLYDVRVPENAKGPWAIEVALSQQTNDSNNVAFYAYDGARWTRVANVSLAPNGSSVSGDVTSPPGALAVLRRTGQAKTMGLILQPGDRLDTKAIEVTSVIAVMAASVGTDGALQATAGVVQSVAPSAGKAKVYLGVSGADSQAAVKNLASATAMSAQAEALAVAAKGQSAAGVYLDYANVPTGQRDVFTAFVKTVRERLQKEQLGLIVGVPASGGANGGYDWSALSGVSDGLWLRGTADPGTYYEQMEQLLTARRAGNTDLGKVSLIIDRRSVDRRGQQLSSITLRDALTAASAIDRKAESTSAPTGGTVALRAQNLGDAPQGASLRWDATSRTVAFSYGSGDAAHSVWIENRFSTAFRMDLASRFSLGGVVVDQAKQDDALPDIWSTVVLYAQDGSVKLERPFGPYLAPCWQAAQGSVEGATACWRADTAPTSVTWRAPQQSGTYPVRLVVSDGAIFVGQEIALRVGAGTPTPTPPPSGTATPTPTARPSGTTAPAPTPTPTAQPTSTPRPTATATPATATPVTPAAPTPPPIQTSTPVPMPPPATPTAAATPFPGGVPPGPAGQ